MLVVLSPTKSDSTLVGTLIMLSYIISEANIPSKFCILFFIFLPIDTFATLELYKMDFAIYCSPPPPSDNNSPSYIVGYPTR